MTGEMAARPGTPTTASGGSQRSIEDFRGDFDALASIVQDSWQENGQALLYTAEFLRSALEYPGSGAALAPTLYEGAMPMGFAAGFPRSAMLDGRPLKLLISSFLSVTPRYKRVGMGGVLLGELVKRARAAGFDGMVQYCIEGGPMNGIVVGLGRTMKFPTAHVHSVSYLSRMLLPRRASLPGYIDEYEPSATTLVELAQALPAAAFARVWSPEEADWQIRGRTGAIAVEMHAEGRRGMLTGYVMQVADGERPKCLFVDDVLWGTLEEPERQALVKRLLDKASAIGVKLAVVPQLGYANTVPFGATHFKPSQRVLHAYLSLWNGDDLPAADLPSMYMDVF